MSDFDNKDVDKYLWGFGFIILTLILSGVGVFYFFEGHKNKKVEMLIMPEKTYGPLAPSPLPTPKGMNGPAEIRSLVGDGKPNQGEW